MGFLTNLSLKGKMLGLCAFMSLVSVAVGAFAFRGLHEVEESYDQVSDLALPSLNALNEMFLEYRSVRINLRTLGLPGLTHEQATETVGKVHEAIAAYERADKVYVDIPFRPGEQELYDQVNSAWKRFKEVGTNALRLFNSGSTEDKAKLMKVFLEDCPAAAKTFTSAVNQLKEFHTNAAKQDTLSAKAHARQANQLILVISALGIAIGLTVGYWLSSGISRGIDRVVSALASGAGQVNEASRQIASSSQELSHSTTEQAASLEETSSSLEEINAMIAKSADNAKATFQSSAVSQRKAEEGRSAMVEMLSSMEEINQSNEAIANQIAESNQKMAEIVRVIEEIGTKTKVINEIVFQTKLLSFNASVEAARAGEHGKGFSVVAEEVGNLAQMSGNAAKEISSLLDQSVMKVNAIVEETKTKVESSVGNGKVKVENGIQVARRCSGVLNEIVQNVEQVSGLSKEISTASEEQAQAVAEITRAMHQLDAVTQNNAMASEKSASAAEELSGQAESMDATVLELSKIVSGNRIHRGQMGASGSLVSLRTAAPAAKKAA